jgi:hypothetical protein
MPGNQPVFKDDSHFIHRRHNSDRTVCELCRHGIIIVVEANQRQGAGMSRNNAMRLKGLRGKRLQKVQTLLIQQFLLCSRLAPKLAIQIRSAA